MKKNFPDINKIKSLKFNKFKIILMLDNKIVWEAERGDFTECQTLPKKRHNLDNAFDVIDDALEVLSEYFEKGKRSKFTYEEGYHK